jgi:glyoxylate/hydroxypyruvate reductase A
MTVVALVSQSAPLAPFAPLLQAADPELDVVVWPDPRCATAVVAVGWDVPPDALSQMPRLGLVHSIAAGVDNVARGLNTQTTALCRVVDPLLAEGMLQYVLWGVLHYHRQMDAALAQQARSVWDRPLQTPAATCRVGVMGLGEMGGRIVEHLPTLGYCVSGWSRSPRQIDGVQLFHGEEGLEPFLAQTDVLVCLLPLTPATQGILGARTFNALPRGAALIHVGRGGHLVEDDLVQALASGQLRGALVDVFAQEPLPADHPLWTTPGVVVTPHMATMNGLPVVIEQVTHNIRQWRAGLPLTNQVDLSLGY